MGDGEVNLPGDLFSSKPSDSKGIEREIGALQLEEKKLLTEIKRTAKTGNEAATKILARQLVRLTQQIANLQGSLAQMRGIATHTQVFDGYVERLDGYTMSLERISSYRRWFNHEESLFAMDIDIDIGGAHNCNDNIDELLRGRF
ncbi:uncharacterized protein LOC130975042 [Arachis stenosperma]|uniref:uncharacterized protein LOC130975042 n=1 Tax=Arachis stenosperma TaxID=217475 RepID=UPI0025AB9BD1|nr:uncharacterized protein LOC130975042 [Arachis stenosperma]